VTGGEYYWMAGNFINTACPMPCSEARTPAICPWIRTELISLCAPRLIFISYEMPAQGGREVAKLDQKGSYMATVAAGVSFKPLDAKDLGVSNDYRTEQMPAVNTGRLDGELAWRQHDGGSMMAAIPMLPM
jgi:hypothetical protein